MTKKFLFLVVFLFFLKNNMFGQSRENLYSGGLSLKTGMGYIAVKDEFISKEKYSGTAPIFIVDWSKNITDYKYQISFEILNTAKLKNNNISTDLSELSLNISYLYSIGDISLFNRKVNFFLGPMPEFFIHYRKQNIASGNIAMFDAYSFATLISFGTRFNFTYQLNDSFLFEGNLQTSLISLGGKFVDPDDNKSSMVKFTYLLNDLRFSFDASVRYHLSTLLSFSGGYKFNMLNMSSWDYIISANDNLFVSLTLSF